MGSTAKYGYGNGAPPRQHRWIGSQPLIAIEIKFLKRQKIHKTGAQQNGFTVSAKEITLYPSCSINLTNDNQRLHQFGQLPPVQTPFDDFIGNRGYHATIAAPYNLVLSTSNVAPTIDAFMQDREMSMVQYPRVLIKNNRKVAISNTVNTLILGSKQQCQTGDYPNNK